MSVPVEQFHKAGRLIESWSRPLVITHERPDGDALGCLVGLTRMLKSLGKNPLAWSTEAPPPRFSRISAYADLKVSSAEEMAIEFDQCDGVIITDTCTLKQLTNIKAFLSSRSVPAVVIDHHVTREEIADLYIVDDSASAASLLVFEMAEVLDWTIDRQVAEALFTGVATDTGWFRFSNTDSRTLAAAARLLPNGVRPDELYQAYYLSDSPARSRLIGALLSQMQLFVDGRIAVMHVTRELLEQCGACRTDTDDLINEAMRIDSVESAILLSTLDKELVKVSLRSKHHVNCATVAEGLGGGGHERAAGVRLRTDLETAQETVLDAISQELTARNVEHPK